MLATIPASFIGIELSVYALFAWGLWSALRRSRFDALSLLAACVFGFMIEYLFAAPSLPHWLQELLGNDRAGSGNSYVYGRFLIMLAGVVPLWVALGWGAISYAARRTSDALGFAWWLAPLADGLLATSVDFALDPVADSLGYWSWHLSGGQPGLSTAFGIPLDNFLGWFMIVGGLSLTTRLAYKAIARWGAKLWLELCCLPLMIVLSLVIAVVVQGVYNWLYAQVTPAATFLLVFGGALALTVSRLPWLRRNAPLDRWSLALIGYMHLYLLVMFFVHHARSAHPGLMAFLPLVVVCSCLAYAWPNLAALSALLPRTSAAPANVHDDVAAQAGTGT